MWKALKREWAGNYCFFLSYCFVFCDFRLLLFLLMFLVSHNMCVVFCLCSLYFPNNPVSGSSRDRTLSEMYLHASHAFGKLKSVSAPGTIGLKEYRDNLAAIVTTLERSNSLQLTGVPVNASRVCENRIKIGADSVTLAQAKASDQTCDNWLQYVRLLRVFINNIEVEE